MIRRGLRLLLWGLLLYLLIGTAVVLFWQPRSNLNSLAGYKKGAFHVHSRFSDGSGDWLQIARAAAEAKLDFVVIADHGNPNLQSHSLNRWQEDVLLMGASELSLHSGHLLAGGFPAPGYRLPPEPQPAIDEVLAASGMDVISHPFDSRIPWTDWSVSGFTGLDILNGYQIAHQAPLAKLLLYPSRALLQPEYALTSLVRYPSRELALWDRLNARSPVYGFYALDAHAWLRLAGRAGLRLPSYASMFRMLNIYLRLDGEWAKDAGASAALAWQALKKGQFFNAIESLAPANGFDAYYLAPNGERVLLGGSCQELGGTLVWHTPFAFAYRVLIFGNGSLLLSQASSEHRLGHYRITQPGSYRVQVHLAGGPFRSLPWILSNPISIAQETEPPATEPLPAPRTSLPLDDFRVEKNASSSASLRLQKNGDGESELGIDFHLQQEPDSPDYWVALANRQARGFAGTRGLLFRVRGSQRLRAWLNVRTGSGSKESGFQQSFPITGEWQTVALSWERIPHLYGKETHLDPGRISSLFIVLDGMIALPGTRGSITLRGISLY